jgi:hypothetical protein
LFAIIKYSCTFAADFEFLKKMRMEFSRKAVTMLQNTMNLIVVPCANSCLRITHSPPPHTYKSFDYQLVATCPDLESGQVVFSE